MPYMLVDNPMSYAGGRDYGYATLQDTLGGPAWKLEAIQRPAKWKRS